MALAKSDDDLWDSTSHSGNDMAENEFMYSEDDKSFIKLYFLQIYVYIVTIICEFHWILEVPQP